MRVFPWSRSFPLLNILALAAALGAGCGVEPVELAEAREPELLRSTSQALVGRALMTGLGGRCVDVREATTSDGATIHMWACHGNASQQWLAQSVGDWLEIRGAQGKCLDVEAGGTADGTRVQLWSCNGAAGQRWTLTPAGNLIGAQGKCLDVRNGEMANGVPLQIWSCNGTAAQQFKLPRQSMQRWASQQGSFSDEQRWLSGDFNGDGKVDVAKAWDHFGLATLDVHLNSGSSFSIQRWATQQGSFSPSQRWMAGDFNGDGKTDVAKVRDDAGNATIDVHLSSGVVFSPQRWATQQGGFAVAQKWMSGDFNGDGKTDLAKVWNDGGYATIDVHLSSGAAFTMQRWATRQSSFWDEQQWMAGDFNGDGKTDLSKVWNDGGRATVDVHLSVGATGEFSGEFFAQRWVTQQGDFWDAQKWMAGDFNGDGKTDLAKVWGEDGRSLIDLHLVSGSTFTIQRWATQHGSYWDQQRWMVGDFNGDRKADLAKAYYSSEAPAGLTHIDVYL